MSKSRPVPVHIVIGESFASSMKLALRQHLKGDPSSMRTYSVRISKR